jgi:hypothetical protein
MTFSQLHERLRIEIVRRIDRGQLTGTLLARQTGLRASHISNFIHKKRKLSLPALDRVLAAQLLSIEDLMPEANRISIEQMVDGTTLVPLVSQATAIHSPTINRRSIIELVHLPSEALDQLRPRRSLARRDWQRFLAVRLNAAQAKPMSPILNAGALIVLDRHYNSFIPNHPTRPNVYAVKVANSLLFRYANYDSSRIILRPHSLDHHVELLRIGADESPSTCIVGRVCLVINEL